MHNPIRRRSLICALAMLALAAPALSAAEPTAKEFLTQLYANYTGKAKGIDYSAELRAAYAALLQQAPRSGFDLFIAKEQRVRAQRRL